ncbi:hypothetical protein L210DRAFT_2505569 [Boletus edulis BED1]|uniref:Secreted protein n=1 Tax=Boletus edulis BED1 TaxID=1328754 RepID=A0AAD4BNY3_BOLED|nr:hypothetical protein L210DRAFT_2505569 [Boletus edulis BED1]
MIVALSSFVLMNLGLTLILSTSPNQPDAATLIPEFEIIGTLPCANPRFQPSRRQMKKKKHRTYENESRVFKTQTPIWILRIHSHSIVLAHCLDSLAHRRPLSPYLAPSIQRCQRIKSVRTNTNLKIGRTRHKLPAFPFIADAPLIPDDGRKIPDRSGHPTAQSSTSARVTRISPCHTYS